MLQGLYAISLLLTQPETIVLFRGAPSHSGFAYCAVEDTFLDSQRADANFGRDGLLSAGKEKTVLIKFGDLPRMLEGKKVVNARLVLTIASGADPTLTE